MKLHANIIELAKKNTDYRKVIDTSPHSQLVLMSLKPNEEIGKEVHKVDQILFFVHGTGRATLDGKSYEVKPHDVVVVPAGTKHNFKNIGAGDLKLFTIYAPAEHKPGTVEHDKKEY